MYGIIHFFEGGLINVSLCKGGLIGEGGLIEKGALKQTFRKNRFFKLTFETQPACAFLILPN